MTEPTTSRHRRDWRLEVQFEHATRQTIFRGLFPQHDRIHRMSYHAEIRQIKAKDYQWRLDTAHPQQGVAETLSEALHQVNYAAILASGQEHPPRRRSPGTAIRSQPAMTTLPNSNNHVLVFNYVAQLLDDCADSRFHDLPEATIDAVIESLGLTSLDGADDQELAEAIMDTADRIIRHTAPYSEPQ